VKEGNGSVDCLISMILRFNKNKHKYKHSRQIDRNTLNANIRNIVVDYNNTLRDRESDRQSQGQRDRQRQIDRQIVMTEKRIMKVVSCIVSE
jgi:hypothetical protein